MRKALVALTLVAGAVLSIGCEQHMTDVPPVNLCKDDDQLDAWCRLTDSPTWEEFPSVSGNRVVWSDWRGPGSKVIVMLVLSTGDTTSLTPEGEDTTLPTIDGDRVIYVRFPLTGPWQLLTYDLTTGVETLFSTIDRYTGVGRLALSGQRAAWHAKRNNNWDIYIFDFNTNGDPTDDGSH